VTKETVDTMPGLRFFSSSPSFSAAASRARVRLGALCTDATFTRVLGTRGASEPILAELLGAWRAARMPHRADAAGPLEATLCDRSVLPSAAPRGRGELIVDVRARNSDEHFIVAMQHRPEPHFSHRCVLYASAEVLAQHSAKSAAKSAAKLAAKSAAKSAASPAAAAAPEAVEVDAASSFASSDVLLPVHSLAFCDYDFQSELRRGGKADGRGALSVKSNQWRANEAHVRNPQLALHVYSLLPNARALRRLGQRGNEALDGDLAARLSFVFALLPHVPRLDELTTRTPPLLRWASLVAYAGPDNVGTVPKVVRSPGVTLLLDQLAGSVAEVEQERAKAEEEDAYLARLSAESKELGKAEGKAELLRDLGITSAALYLARFGKDPPPGIAEQLEKLT
jgi:hypothetical protein